MIVSRVRSFVFVHIPKAGGTSFRSLIQPYHDYSTDFWWVRKTSYLGVSLDHAHLRSWEVMIFYPDVWEIMQSSTTICFFRNPAERFVSAVYEHFRQFKPSVGLSELPWREQQAVAREFTQSIDLERVFWDPTLIHFSPQTWFTHLRGQQVVKTIFPLIEGFDAFRAAGLILGLPDLGPTPNSAPARNPIDLLGEELLGRVRRLYEDDYALCGSADHLRALATP